MHEGKVNSRRWGMRKKEAQSGHTHKEIDLNMNRYIIDINYSRIDFEFAVEMLIKGGTWEKMKCADGKSS